MKVAVPKEIKNNEFRVGLTPDAVAELTGRGHQVMVENRAGEGVGFDNSDYETAGGKIVDTADEIFDQSCLIIKVKEPLAEERARLSSEHTLFTFLHLAPDIPQTSDLLKSGATCIAYETVSDAKGGLPILAPMSEVAGKMSIQAGARCLEKAMLGRGVLLGGVPGVKPAKVVIIGGGVVGQNAAVIAIGMGAEVTVLDKSLDVLRTFDRLHGNRIRTVYSTSRTIEKYVISSDLVIGSVLLPGAAAPKLITKEMIKKMKTGSVLVDVAIDQGGCAETSRPTTHDNPTFVVDDVVHYCVANMPGAVARTATMALNNVALPYIIELADKGSKIALTENSRLLEGLNICGGRITHLPVAESQGLMYTPAIEMVATLR